MEITENSQASDTPPLQIGMLVYPQMTLLDLVGPQTALGFFGKTHLVAKALDPVPTDTGISILPTTTYADCPKDLDVLFVPGEGLSQENRCVAIDFRGWGQSSKEASDYGLETLADDVLGVVDELSLKEFILVGHSMGGKLAQLVVAQQPQGLQRLILVAPAIRSAIH